MEGIGFYCLRNNNYKSSSTIHKRKTYLSIVLLVLVLIFSLSNKNSKLTANSELKAKSKLVLPSNKNDVAIQSRVPPFKLTDHTGKTVEHTDFYGYVWVVNVTHSQCKAACAVQMSLMDGMQNALSAASFGKNLRFVTLSMEPEFDTVEVLAEYVKKYNFKTSQWHFLTGTRNAIWNLSKKGLHLKTTTETLQNEGVISNSPKFVLIDWEGRIRGQYAVKNKNDINIFRKNILTVINERTAVPETVVKRNANDPRQQRQIDLAKKLDIFTDFKFSDELSESGITFKHKIIDDVGSAYKAVHYDHGNGIAVADVDLDGFYDIYFTSLSGTNELWRNLGNGQFENITDKSGLNISDRIGMGAAFADIDNDGDPDLYITNVRVGNLLFENDGKGKFKNITKSSGTGVKAHSAAALFFDYDRDGLLDLFVANVGKFTTENKLKTTLYSDRGQIQTEYEYYEGFKDAFGGHLKPERAEASILFKNMGKNRFENVNQKVNLDTMGGYGHKII